MAKGNAVAEIGTGFIRKTTARKPTSVAGRDRRMEILRYVNSILQKFDVGPERFTIYPTMDELLDGARKVEAYLNE